MSPSGSFVEPITKTAIPIPPLPSLRIPPLGVIADRGAAHGPDARHAQIRTQRRQRPAHWPQSTNSPDSVTGDGEIDSVRYGHVLRARKLVGVRGAGLSYDGNYYVKRVTHTITRGDYKQSFTVSREGTGATLPVVIP